MAAQLAAAFGWRLPATWAEVVIVLGFACLGLVCGGILIRKHRPQPVPPAAVPSEQPTTPAHPARATGMVDQREIARRCGTWFKVVLMDAQAGGPFFEGHVVDFTPGGLGLMLLQEIPVGKVLSARHATAPASVPWVQLEVMFCQQLEKTVWKVGCHVDDPTLWNTLVQSN
ncbi:MAG TPA: hypothetical protein VG013_04940 [Gemmataceae bacterium]|jgi:hypothetical protein|nr:hypothetical protein [Gemmataceae bacterium]